MAASCRELAGLARPAATASSQPGRGRNELCFAPLRQEERQGRRSRRGAKVVVAAVSEELPRLASAGKAAGRPPQGKVALRAALTVRRKQKEDHLDALWDMVGRGVLLELISTKIDPNGRCCCCSTGGGWGWFEFRKWEFRNSTLGIVGYTLVV